MTLHSHVNRLREWNGQRPPICEGAQSGSLPSPPLLTPSLHSHGEQDARTNANEARPVCAGSAERYTPLLPLSSTHARIGRANGSRRDPFPFLPASTRTESRTRERMRTRPAPFAQGAQKGMPPFCPQPHYARIGRANGSRRDPPPFSTHARTGCVNGTRSPHPVRRPPSFAHKRGHTKVPPPLSHSHHLYENATRE